MLNVSKPRRTADHCTRAVATLMVAGTWFGFCMPLRAQSAPPPVSHVEATPSSTNGAASITVNSRLVVLDVVVTDSSGRPVSDLSAKDFKVFEDNVPQPIRSVEPPSSHRLPAATAATGISEAFNPAQPASFGAAPVTILVLDQLNTHFSDSSFARRSLHDYLAAQPAVLAQPTTLLSVFDGHFKALQQFTRDRDALLHALAAAPPEYAWKLEVQGKADYGPIARMDQSLRALEQIAESYSRIQGRKNLVWIGGGFPSIDPTTIDREDAQEVKDTLEHITNLLLDTRVTLYAVDPSSSAAGMTEITDSTQLQFAEAAGDALSGNFDPFAANADFDRLGPLTGGRVVRGKNDVARQIASAIDLGDTFYTISYKPSSASEKAVAYRTIRVVCLRPGLTATTRSGYYPGASQRPSAVMTAYDLTTAAETGLPLNGIRVVADTTGAASGVFHVRAAVSTLTWQTTGSGSSTASVSILAVSLSPKNKMLGHTLHSMTATARPGTDLADFSKLADFDFPVIPSPGASTLRFVVQDKASGRIGTFDLPLNKH